MIRACAAALALLLLAGCQAAGPAEQPGPALGLSSAEESCRTALRRAGARADMPVWDVLCGTSTRPVGAVHGNLDPGRETGAAALRDSAPYRALTARAECRAPEALRLPDAGEAWIASCALKDGGWPWLVMAFVAPGRLSFGEGTPGSIPALAEALARAGGGAY